MSGINPNILATRVARLLVKFQDDLGNTLDVSGTGFCLMQPLTDYLASLPASDNPDAYIFPRAGNAKRTASLSNQFREIMADAGLVEPRTHQSTGKGRSRMREQSELSFHSLRHSAVTMLKAAGVSDFMAREIVGHESTAVSRQYTHLTTDDKRAAMRRLPDVTNT
jgi:integrase